MLYNTIGLRFIAILFDNLLLLPLMFVSRGENENFTWITAVILLLEHTYFIIGHAQYGQTLGKRFLGLKVVRAHQHLPIGWKHAIMRELLWIALSLIYTLWLTDPEVKWAMIPGMVIILSDTLLALMHPQNRSLRDFIAKTVVIREVAKPGQD